MRHVPVTIDFCAPSREPSQSVVSAVPPWIGVAVTEYEAHREEVVAEAHAQQQVLALGATAVGVVMAGTFNVWDDRLLASVALLGVVPLLSILVLIQWAGRAYGMMRVGVYLEEIEGQLREATRAPAPLLTWEMKLASSPKPQEIWKPHTGWADFGAVAVFSLLAGGAIVLGAYRGWEDHELVVSALAIVQALAVVLAATLIGKGMAKVREQARLDFARTSSTKEARA